jgi:cysteine desulfurase/selenocysteine lyase
MSVTVPPAAAGTRRRYLDHAATSWPKPPDVLAAWEHAGRAIGAAAGRAAYREAAVADEIRLRCRAAAAAVLGGVDPQRVALPSGGTLALNMAIHGVVRPGDHVIATAADHNASLRPLHWLQARGTIDLTLLPCDAVGRVDPAAVVAAWRRDTRLVVCAHASNVTGVVQDAAAIGRVARDRGGLVLLDAAQSLGLMPCGPDVTGADIIAAPGHKWLQGPAGVAILWVREGVALEPVIQGGTGSASDSLEMPERFVERFEAGTPDLPALAGLRAAVEWIAAQATQPADATPAGIAAGVEAVGRRCRDLAAEAAAGLASVGARVLTAHGTSAPIVSFTVEGYDPGELAVLLEQVAGVQVRSGFHCAARIHPHLGTQAGGTVRASFGPFNTDDDVAALVDAVRRLRA